MLTGMPRLGVMKAKSAVWSGSVRIEKIGAVPSSLSGAPSELAWIVARPTWESEGQAVRARSAALH